MFLVLKSLPLKFPENKCNLRLRFNNGRGLSNWPKTLSKCFFSAVIFYRRRKTLLSLGGPFLIRAIFFCIALAAV